MAYIKIKSSHVKNPKFEETILGKLGDSWSITLENGFWLLSLKSQKFPTNFYDPVKKISLDGQSNLPLIIDTLSSVESSVENRAWHDAADQNLLQLDHWEAYGILSDLYVENSTFFVDSLASLKNTDKLTTISNLIRDLNIRDGIAYRKNMLPFMTLYSFIKNAFLIENGDINLNTEIPSERFVGALPIGSDLGTYINSFLIFAPYSFAIPFNRMTSGLILIPEKEVMTPYISYSGWSDIFTSTPISALDSSPFNLFNGIVPTKIFLRRYAFNLIEQFNNFIGWMYHPDTCSLNGEFIPELMLQLHGSINSVFKSFQYCSKRLNSDERLIHFFNVVDKLANLVVNMKHRRSDLNKKIDYSGQEARYFINMLSPKFSKKIEYLISKAGFDEKLTKAMIRSLQDSENNVNTSLSHFNKASEDTLRIIRNSSHGGFLRRNEFINTFKLGKLELSSSLYVRGYYLMLAFLVDPEKFITDLAALSE